MNTSQTIEAFTFGEAAPLSYGDLIEALGAWVPNGQPYYAPPVSYDLLSKTFASVVYQQSPIFAKRNVLFSLFEPTPFLNGKDFRAFVLDFLVFGNAYLERVEGKAGAWKLQHCLAKFTRRGTDLNQYFYLGQNLKDPHMFKRGKVFHLHEPDINQEIYGVPEYMGAMASAWLNREATLFRQKFYANGAHAGSIIFVRSAESSDQAINNFKDQLKKAKQDNQFKNVFVHLPNADKDAIQIMSLSEATGKDEFFNVTKVSRDDLLAAHRVPPQFLAALPNNTAGFGDAAKAAQVFYAFELLPLMQMMRSVNEWAGAEVVRFKAFDLMKEGKE